MSNNENSAFNQHTLAVHAMKQKHNVNIEEYFYDFPYCSVHGQETVVVNENCATTYKNVFFLTESIHHQAENHVPIIFSDLKIKVYNVKIFGAKSPAFRRSSTLLTS